VVLGTGYLATAVFLQSLPRVAVAVIAAVLLQLLLAPVVSLAPVLVVKLLLLLVALVVKARQLSVLASMHRRLSAVVRAAGPPSLRRHSRCDGCEGWVQANDWLARC
jgi:hypothetical protein